jgi:CrcB protein
MTLNNSMLRAPIAVGLGAIAGALCRYFIGQWLTQTLATGFPIGTMLINLSGCFLMGLVTTLVARRFALSPDVTLLITTGFLGAYTTFSSYELDTARLVEARNLQADLKYWVGTPLLGFLCFSAGVGLGRLPHSSNSTEDSN